jgi:acetyl esterase/lipase
VAAGLLPAYLLPVANLARFVGGLALLGLASLTLLPPPTRLLWAASIAATEWGYWLAFAALLPLIPARQRHPLGRLGALCSIAAIALFLAPIVRASSLNHDLPAAFDQRFGADRRQRTHFAESPRAEPLVLAELLRPVQSPPIRFGTHELQALDGQALTLDVYRPGYVHGPLPALIVIHGGLWTPGTNSEFLALNAYLAARDYVVVALNYRQAPQSRFPVGRDDVLASVAYVKVHAEELGIDPARLAILGRSSGGQLALLAAYTAGDSSIRGAISLYGESDLAFEYEHPAPGTLLDTRGLLEAYLGGSPAAAADAYFAASPVNFVTAGTPATLLIHGMRDSIVEPEQTARLESRLQRAGVKHLAVRLPWATHGCDRSFGGPCGQIAAYAVERFLDAVMIPPPVPAPKGRAARQSAAKKPQ